MFVEKKFENKDTGMSVLVSRKQVPGEVVLEFHYTVVLRDDDSGETVQSFREFRTDKKGAYAYALKLHREGV